MFKKYFHYLLIFFAFLYLLFMNWKSLTGFYLSDTASHFSSCYRWHKEGELWTTLLSFFVNGNSYGSTDMYRPLGMVSLCTDFILFKDYPFILKFIQLGFHYFNSLLLFFLVKNIFNGHVRANLVASFSAIIFLLSPVAPEVSMWIGVRFDALVQVFMLLSCLLHWKGKKLLASLCLVLALISKESSIIIPAMLFSMSFFKSNLVQFNFIEKLFSAIKSTWYYWLLALFYMIGRDYLFGSSLHVYASEGSFIGNFFINLTKFTDNFSQLVIGPWLQSELVALFWISFFMVIGISFWLSYINKLLNLWLMFFSWVIFTLLALTTQVGSIDQSGTGARILYNSSAWWSILVAMPLLFVKRKWILVLMAYSVFLAYVQSFHIKLWSQASSVSKKLFESFGQLKPLDNKDDWTLVLVPDHIGVALLARNAQGSLVLPPFQKKRLLDSFVPFTKNDLEVWRLRINTNFVGEFKKNTNTPNQFPIKYYCTHRDGEIIEIEIDNANLISKVNWKKNWEAKSKEKACYF